MIHEMGHVLGFGDSYGDGDVMGGFLSPGTRRLPSAQEIADWMAVDRF